MAKPEKRRLFDELIEAVEDINQWREGKITLKTYTVEKRPCRRLRRRSSGHQGKTEPVTTCICT